MEPISTTKVMELAVGKVAEILFKGASDRVRATFQKDDVERAIKGGLRAIADWEKDRSPQEWLFYSAKPDGIGGKEQFLDRVFGNSGVQEELRKPLENEGKPDADFLVETFREEAKASQIPLNEPALNPWVATFVSAYFERTHTYRKFQVVKRDYCEQLAKYYDDVRFAGISVAGQESEQCGLVQIFVMPDVREDVSTQREWMTINLEGEERREQFASRSPRTFLAAELLKQVRSPRAVLLGAPGSGKTTLMSYFAVMLAESKTAELGLNSETDWLPILIRMRDLARYSETSLIDDAKQFAEKTLAVKELPPGFFEYWLEDGRSLILLDGLDEISDEAKRTKVVRQIETFLGQYDRNPAIITSRPAGYRRDFFRTEEFPHFRLQPFDNDKIAEFIHRWYDSRVEDPAEAERRKDGLQKALKDSDRIRRLAQNPLLLTIITLIHRYQAILPKRRYELYDKAVETLMISWDANKELTSHKVLQYLELDDLRRVMERLAYWVQTQGNSGDETGDKDGGTLIDRDELIDQLKREIKTLKRIELYQATEEAERFVNFIRDRTGLLNEQGQDYYAFVHKTFQEYLCTQEIDYQADNDGDFDIVLDCIRDRLHDSHWREVLLLLIAQQKPKKAAKAIRAILDHNSEDEKWLHRDLLFAGYCLAEDPKNLSGADSSLGEEILTRLVELEVQIDDKVGEKVHEQVFQVLRSFYETDFQDRVLELLKARSESIKEEKLFEYQVEFGEKLIVKEAVISSLIKYIKDEYRLNPKKLHNYAHLLSEFGQDSDAVVKKILQCLNDENPQVKFNAIYALNKLSRDSDVVANKLLQCLDDENPQVQLNAAYILGESGRNFDAVVEKLLQCLNDENPQVKSRAAHALGESSRDFDAVVEKLLQCLNDENPQVKSSAAYALGRLCQRLEATIDEAIIDILLQCLKDESSWVRDSAANALGRIGQGSEAVVTALLQCLAQEKDSQVRGSAALSIGQLGQGCDVVETTLLQCLEDKSSRVRGCAAVGLSWLHHRSETIEIALIKSVKDENSWVRGRSIFCLWQLGQSSEAVVTALLLSLGDEDSSIVRGSAARALGLLGKNSDAVRRQIIEWLDRNSDSEYIGRGIDALWGAAIDES